MEGSVKGTCIKGTGVGSSGYVRSKDVCQKPLEVSVTLRCSITWNMMKLHNDETLTEVKKGKALRPTQHTHLEILLSSWGSRL